MRKFLFLFALLLAAVAPAQAPWILHGPAPVLIAGDVDQDGYDDLVAIDSASGGATVTHYGSRTGLKPSHTGGSWVMTSQLSDRPLLAERFLVAPNLSGGGAWIDLYTNNNRGGWWHVGWAAVPQGSVTSMKICLEPDMDGDRVPEIRVVWSTRPQNQSASFYHAQLNTATILPGGRFTAPAGITSIAPKTQHYDTRIADVHLSDSVSKVSPEFLVVMTGPPKTYGGFGLVLLSKNKIDAQLWSGKAPVLIDNSHSHHEASNYGRIALYPSAGSIALRLITGHVAVLQGWPVKPWVRLKGNVIPLSPTGRFPASAARDFDGDALQESVFLEGHYAAITDPSAKRTWMSLKAHAGRCLDAAAGDFDGDKLPDLAVSHERGRQTALAVYKNMGKRKFLRLR